MTEQGTLRGLPSPHLTTHFNWGAVKRLKAEREHFPFLTLSLHYSPGLWDSSYGFQYAALYTLLQDAKALLHLFPPLAVPLTGFAVSTCIQRSHFVLFVDKSSSTLA